MGYEVQEQNLDIYTQHLFSKMVDPNKETFGIYKEKSLKLHQEFNKLVIEKKVRKEVEALVERMGITKEVV